MSLLTLFSSPKPFTDPKVAVIQENAIGSWVRLPDVQVLLMGDEEGLARVALASGAKHVPNVATNAAGTPLISSMVQRARDYGDGGMLCIVNADMILMSDFVEVARWAQTMGESFVVVSRRWDLEVDVAPRIHGRMGGAASGHRAAARRASPPGRQRLLFVPQGLLCGPSRFCGGEGWLGQLDDL